MESRLAPLVGTGNPNWTFTGDDLEGVGFSQDELRLPGRVRSR